MGSYVLKDIFGDTGRVRILEELAERWEEYLTVSEIARMADVSPNTVYPIVRELEKFGIIKSQEGRATKYGLNPEDERALFIAKLEDQQYLNKLQNSIEELEIEEKLPKYLSVESSMDYTNNFVVSTSTDGNYPKLGAESK